MDSPTKRFKKSTAKFIRNELAATQHSSSFLKLVGEVGLAVLIGIVASMLVVIVFYGG